jgi:hypothetical protein
MVYPKQAIDELNDGLSGQVHQLFEQLIEDMSFSPAFHVLYIGHSHGWWFNQNENNLKNR